MGAEGAKEAMLELWREIVALRRPCSATDLPSAGEKLAHLLGSYEDLHCSSMPPKRISAQGAVCLARIQWYAHDYTGLFRRADYGLLRMSSALPTKLSSPSSPIVPYAPGSLGEAVIVPFVALKLFRSNFGSGNMIFGGRKTGQKEADFFANCVCSHLTEKISFPLWPVLRAFRKHSRFPCQTGLSDAASVSQDGGHEQQPRFPWVLLLRPGSSTKALSSEVLSKSKGDANFLAQLAAIPAGETVYQILACPSPAVAKRGPMQHIGDLVTASRFVESALEARLRFRHQVKEEDYVHEPNWESELTKEHVNLGWEHFSQLPADKAGEALPSARYVVADEVGTGSLIHLVTS
eukprot:TRINITY_DN11291_c0_g3_i1.p1 TRINITY_DN11291_c0_g3~~TRINITY_DN11291_c0_g3_i1.p1  ORF type:complete len:407 (-),score=65.54 TRINITY_DN11291_c0_g3_i1:49-1098(-)